MTLRSKVLIASTLVLSLTGITFSQSEPAFGMTTPRVNQSAIHSCLADGDTINVAMAAFEANSPKVVPTISRLLSKANGGPYLESWAHNAPIYTYSISPRGVLLVAAPSGFQPVPFSSRACTNAGRNQSAINSCVADGDTINVAMAAFEANSPKVVPTISRLLSKANGGPYLESWAHNAPIYTYSISPRGVLLVAAPSGTKKVNFTRQACVKAG
ncbi:MAG: hypothetical protein HIU84_11935 [Acidobacteria bacterium]|nr:hypothetical protein [Acidobacteriota bacterium]